MTLSLKQWIRSGFTTRQAELLKAEIAAGGASGAVGKVCWFEAVAPMPAGPGDTAITWAATSDGVAAFTDAAVGVDPTHITIVHGGAWHFDVTAMLNGSSGADAHRFGLVVRRGDDSVGPLYDLTPEMPYEAGESVTVALSFDFDFADGEILVFTARGLVAATSLQWANLSGRRLGAHA